MTRTLRFLCSISAIASLSVAACHDSGTELPGTLSRDIESAASTPAMAAPTQVGEEVSLLVRSPAAQVSRAMLQTGEPALVWQKELSAAGATYIAPHFAAFSLPEGAHVVVRSANGQRSRTYTGTGKAGAGTAGFWAMHMPGERAVVELYSYVDVPEGAVIIDRFARGTEAYKGMFPSAGSEDIEFGPEAICGSDESNWAQCFQSSEPEAYDKSRAVARLMINGTSACTGWLVGSEGHLLTNQHCIGTATDAANTDYEFLAEGTCTTECRTFGGCPGVVEADTAELVAVDAGLDYALVRLPTNLSTTYGFFQLRLGGGFVGERIYIPQHPAAWGKRIAFRDGDQNAVITSLNEDPCSGDGQDVGYMADTQGGSSGSPVVAYEDHLVVALHHCAFCPNRGVPVQAIIDHLGDNVPEDAVSTGCEPEPVANAGADRTICLGESVVLGTPAAPDTTYLWSPGPSGNETSAQISVSPTQTTTYTLTATTVCDVATDTVTVTVDDGSTTGLNQRFDTALTGWTATGLWHQVNNSTCANPGYASPTGAMYYGKDATCNYNTGAATSGDLISPEVTGITSQSKLSFQFFRKVESGSSGSYDRTKVFVTTNNGATWTEVWSRDSRNASENAWTSSGNISLAAFAGQTIKVRFHFNSVDSSSNNFAGWLIDDVVITGQTRCSGNTAPQAAITAPASGHTVTEGTPIAFAGTASDSEDGTLTGSLSWTSDIDGVIGTGGSFSTTLSRGTHTITASVSDSGGLLSTATVTVVVTEAVSGFLADFEGAVTGWTTSGLWHLVSNSTCASPGYASPVRSMYYGKDGTCNYSTGALTTGELVSPNINGVTASSVLRFDFFRKVELKTNGSFDRTKVFVSGDNGVTWTEVWSRDSRNASENAWTSSGNISLAAFAGRTIKVRFHFTSVDHVNNAFTGWMIDNVSVQ